MEPTTPPIPPKSPKPVTSRQNSNKTLLCRPIELFVPEIKQLLESKNYAVLKELVNDMNPIDLADGMPRFSPEQQILIFKLLTWVRMMEVFEESEPPIQRYILEHLEDQSLAPLLEDISAEVTAKLFKKLPEKLVKKMTNLMNKERIEVVQDIMEYPPETVGAMMRTNYIHVPPDTTSRATMALLQARSRVRVEDNINIIFVTNATRKLLGGVDLRTLIAAPGEIKMREIMSPMSPIRIQVTTDREEAADIFIRYKIMSAPVVDEEGRLVGVLDADDVLQVIEKESTEDIQKLAGVEALEEPYFQTSFMHMVRKRSPWLCILFVGETLTASAMGFFEHELAKAVVLATFIPLIISSGGNSGSQAATLIVRALALKEITFSDWWKVMRREFFSGVVLGAMLGGLGFAGIMVWSQFTTMYGPHYFLLASTVAVTLLLIVLWGSLAGSLFPIFLKRIGLDPAVASTPFVATMVDVTGLIIYFSVALAFLKGTLL